MLCVPTLEFKVIGFFGLFSCGIIIELESGFIILRIFCCGNRFSLVLIPRLFTCRNTSLRNVKSVFVICRFENLYAFFTCFRFSHSAGSFSVHFRLKAGRGFALDYFPVLLDYIVASLFIVAFQGFIKCG